MLYIATYANVEYVDGSDVFVCLTIVDTFWRIFFFVGSITLFFIIPFFILLVLYSVIAKHLMNNPGIISYGHRSNVLKYRKQVIFMLAAVVISFFVCLLPFRGLTIWIIIASNEDVLSLGVEKYYNLLYFSRIMLYLNSAMNPILYNLMSSKFREGFFRLLGCRSFVGRKKFIHGAHKGTFHTTSTNLSSSQSNDRRIHHQHRNHHSHSHNHGTSTGSFSSSNNRKRMSETFEDSCPLPSEYLVENGFPSNGKLPNGRKKNHNNFGIKKCLVESTVINAIAHEPAANRDLSRKIKENFTAEEPCSEFMSEVDSLMDEEEVVVSRRNSRNLGRRPSRQLEFNNICRENGNGDVIVVLIKPVTTSPIHEETHSLAGSEDEHQHHKHCHRVIADSVEQNGKNGNDSADHDGGDLRQKESDTQNGGVEYDFSEAVFLAAKESVV